MDLKTPQEKKQAQEDFSKRKRRLLLKFKALSRFALKGLLEAMPTMEKLPDKVLLQTFSYLSHKEILKCSRVCQKWRQIAYDSRLWAVVSLRPAYDGLQVTSMEALLALISVRFGPNLRLMELSTDLITTPVIHELANKCPKLQYLTLDFSAAMQLHDFSDMQTFPSRLKSLTICLSENIFLEGFLRKIYTFIGSVDVLHLIGTYEKIEDEEEEVYETVNITKLKMHMPNLRVVNFWGVLFVTDEHIESLSSSCANLECVCVNYCQKVRGTSLKFLLQRCKKLRCLLLEQTSLDNKSLLEVAWEKSSLQELNVAATDINTEVLISMLTRLPHLKWLSAGFLEQFNDQVLEAWIESNACRNIQCLDLNTCDLISEGVLNDFLTRCGQQLIGLNLGGNHRLLEWFWTTTFPKLTNIKILVMGIAEDCCTKVTAKIHIDSFVDSIANHSPQLERLEIRWDPETLRFSDKSSKFIDILRMKCLKLKALTLSDGQYYELVKSNFERADRTSVVRTTEMCHTSIAEHLCHYRDLLFN